MKSLTKIVTSENGRYAALVLFLIVVLVMGGGSRDDIQSLILLRPIAIFFVGYALLVGDRSEFDTIRWPLTLLLSLMIIMAIQLIPFPPMVWQQFPVRDSIIAADRILGTQDVWRPITLSPSKGLNSLFSLTVPLAALLLISIQKVSREKMMLTALGLGLISGAWAYLQVLTNYNDLMYLYQITSNGSATGLFANRNHQAVFLGSMLVFTAWSFSTLRPNMRSLLSKILIHAIIFFLVLLLIVVTGSRAGVLVAAIASVASLWFIWLSPLEFRYRAKSGARSVSVFLIALCISGIAAISAPILLTSGSGVEIWDQIFAREFADDLRFALIPTYLQMIAEYFPFGSGFGTFEYVYPGFEPEWALNSTYLNHAHNDWMQWLIEGGALGILLLAIYIMWSLSAIYRGLTGQDKSSRNIVALCGIVLALWAIGSFFDYPLRVPLIMAWFALTSAILSRSVGTRPNSAAVKGEIA